MKTRVSVQSVDYIDHAAALQHIVVMLDSDTQSDCGRASFRIGVMRCDVIDADIRARRTA